MQSTHSRQSYDCNILPNDSSRPPISKKPTLRIPRRKLKFGEIAYSFANSLHGILFLPMSSINAILRHLTICWQHSFLQRLILKLLWTDGRPQSRWRERMLESCLTDIRASPLAVGSLRFYRHPLPLCSHTKLVPCSTAWLQSLLGTVLITYDVIRSIHRANIVGAQLTRTSVMCLLNDNRLFNVTPSTLSLSTLVNPRTAIGGSTTECRNFVLLMSSANFDQFKTKFLSFAHSMTWSTSTWQDLIFDAGTIRYMSSANIVMALTGESGSSSVAVTMNGSGSR